MSVEPIKAGKKHLHAAFTAITSIQSNKEVTHFLAKKRPASTAHMEIQLRFHFTKKKHYVKPRLAKPNHEEVSNVLRILKMWK